VLAGHQEEHPTCQKWSDEVLAWLYVCRKVQMTYGAADAKATSSLASLKSGTVLPFWCPFTQVVLEKRPYGCLNYYIHYNFW